MRIESHVADRLRRFAHFSRASPTMLGNAADQIVLGHRELFLDTDLVALLGSEVGELFRKGVDQSLVGGDVIECGVTE